MEGCRISDASKSSSGYVFNFINRLACYCCGIRGLNGA
jgi:hypothetical protein